MINDKDPLPMVDNTMEILQSIKMVKLELRMLKEDKKSHEAQLECFKRLVNLYSVLNIALLEKAYERKSA